MPPTCWVTPAYMVLGRYYFVAVTDIYNQVTFSESRYCPPHGWPHPIRLRLCKQEAPYIFRKIDSVSTQQH